MSNDYRPGGRRRSHSRYSRKPQKASKKENFFLGFLKKLFGSSKTENGQASSYRKDGFTNKNKRSFSLEKNFRPSSSGSGTRSNAPLEVTSGRLYIGNLSYDAAESDLFDLLVQAAPVRNVEIARERRSNRSKGFGFVEMETIEGAKLAQSKFQGYELMGRNLVISGAKNRSENFSQT